MMSTFDFDSYVCPVCGEYPDYCQGHGEIGDPHGHEVLQRHYDGDHSTCVPSADCEAWDDYGVARVHPRGGDGEPDGGAS